MTDFFGSDYELTIANPMPPMMLVLGGLILLLMGIFSYWTYRAHRKGFWMVPAIMRFSAVGLLAVCISQPSLKSTHTIVSRGKVAILVDGSKSMSLPDLPGSMTRHEKALRCLFGDDADLLDELSRSFDVELYEFDSEVRKVAENAREKLSPPEGSASRLAEALHYVTRNHGEVPLAGMVLLSDGQDNGASDVAEAAQSSGVPVFTVGIGSKKKAGIIDLVLTDLKVEKTALVGSTVVADITVLSRGMTGLAPLKLKRGSKQLDKALARLNPGSKESCRLSFVPQDPGQFVYTISTPVKPGELTAKNNRISFSLEVVDRSYDVLYIEGMMRWEYKFLRRALLEDKDVHVESFLRVGPDRFYRQPGRKRPGKFPPGRSSLKRQELPLNAARLRDFNLVIFGDIAAKHFTADQLRAVADFVSDQGGAFLALGGKSSLASGGYAGTPIDRILPVAIKPKGELQSPGEFRPVLTPEGLGHPILQLSPNPAANHAIWAGLPPLAGSNRTGAVKPGAATLLVRKSGRRITAPDIILAVQRYGKGKTALLAADTTWRWDFESLGRGGDSSAYKKFWAQLVRWLMPDLESTPENEKPVRVATDKPEYRQMESVHIEARVLQADGKPQAQPELRATLINPKHAASSLPFKETGTPGVFAASFIPRVSGPYEVSVQASLGTRALGNDSTAFLVGEATQELVKTDLNDDLLRSISAVTNGKYTTPATCQQIASLVPEIKKETIRTERVRLWNNPLLLAAFICLAGIEWLVRRLTVGV